jgi:molybdopterin molybdotransferase
VAVAPGAAVPHGADAVVMFEATRRTPGGILIDHPVTAGDRIAEAGEDLPRGAALVAKGDVLTPPRLASLAMFGRSEVRAYARPLVALVPNGNELLGPGAPRRAGHLYESNNISLAAVVRACGGDPVAYAPVPDDPSAIERVLRRAAGRCDVVVSTGGSSVGERDFLPAVFARIGRVAFHGIAVRPGKPTLAATHGGVLFLGMPGHPTSCLANMYWLVGPALRRIARLPGSGWSLARVRLREGYPLSGSAMTTVVPLRVSDGWAVPTFRDSSAITSLSGANAFVLVPPRHPSLRRGEEIEVCVLPPPIAEVPASIQRAARATESI